MREWFEVTNAAPGKGGGEILIYGVIGRSSWGDKEGYVPAKEFITALDKMVAAGPGDVHIRINSPGGDVWDGTAIYNGILKHRDRCYCTVEGVAFSMASVIALAGRECRMYDTAQIMIHNPKTFAYGEEKDFEQTLRGLKTAKTALMKAYTGKSGKSDQEVSDAMSATTWMTADEAKEFGFVDVVISDEAPSIAACFDMAAWQDYYRNGTPLPELVSGEAVPVPDLNEDGEQAPVTGGDAPQEDKSMPKLTAKEIREACPGASADFVLAQVEACDANEDRGLADVLKAHNVELSKAAAAAEARAVEAEAKAKQPEQPGVAPLAASGGNDEPEADPITAWEDAVEAGVARKMTRAQAIRAVAVGNPELHKAYLAAYNAQFGRTVN